MEKDLFTIAREKALAELHKRKTTKAVALRTLEIYKELKEEAEKQPTPEATETTTASNQTKEI